VAVHADAESLLLSGAYQMCPHTSSREEPKVARVIPRIAEGFEELVADLPNAVKRDVDRARATIRRYVGDKIPVAEEIQDGQPVVTFRTCKGQMEAAFLRIAGSSSLLQTSVVGGADLGLIFRPEP
jgi:hypothetical protein